MKKRVLALVTVFVLIFQGFSVISPAAAASTDSSVVKLLDALEIMTVDQYTGNFWNDIPVERQEMAKILCSLFRFDVKTDSTPKFLDVPEKNRAYIETAVRNGYMSGYSADSFGPEDYVTYEQLVKIFVSVLGADSLAQNMGGFPTGYIAAARRLGIGGKNLGSTTAAARRIDVANVIYDTLNTGIVNVSGVRDGELLYTVDSTRTFLTEIMDIYHYTGVLTKNGATAYDDPTGLSEDAVLVGDNLFGDEKHLADGYLGCSVSVYVKKADEDSRGEIIFIEEGKHNNIVAVEKDDLIRVDGKNVEYYEGTKSKTLKMSPVVDMIYNGKAIDFDSNKIMIKNGSLRFIDNNDDKEFDLVDILEYDTYIVDYVNADSGVIYAKYDKDSLDVSDCFLRVYKDGEETDITSVARGDVVLAAVSEGSADKAIRIEICSEYVSGTVDKITKSKGDTYVTVAGKSYRVSEYCNELVSKGKLEALKTGNSYMLYFDNLDGVAYFSNNSKGGNVGYLVASAASEDGFDSSLSVKIFTIDNKIELFATGDKITINEKRQKVKDVTGNVATMEKFRTPQLVKYSAKDGVLNEITFPESEYKALKFSKAADSKLTCSNTSVLGDKYFVSASTRVFCVPTPVSDEEVYYNVYNGSYFIQGWSYDTELYGVDEMGNTDYVVVSVEKEASNITDGSPILAVEEVQSSIDSDGYEIKILKGKNESGKDVEVAVDKNTALTDSSVGRDVQVGDIIQYGTNYNGKIAGIKILKYSESDYFLPTAIYSGTGSSTKKIYGEVIRGSSSNVLVYCGTAQSDMPPTKASKNIANNGNAVFEWDEDTESFEAIKFSEIEFGDRVFALVNASNRTRMLIVYKRGE